MTRHTVAILAGAVAAVVMAALLVTVTPRPRPVDGTPAPVVAFVGDSYTTGFAADPTSARWSTRVCEHYGWVERNVGIGGTGYLRYVGRGEAYFQRAGAVQQAHPDMVIVSGGLNDGALVVRAPAEESTAILATFQRLRAALPSARIYAIRPFVPASLGTVPVLTAMAQQIRAAVTAVHGTYLDVGTPLRGRTASMSPDGLHPNNEGYATLARSVEQAYDRSR